MQKLVCNTSLYKRLDSLSDAELVFFTSAFKAEAKKHFTLIVNLDNWLKTSRDEFSSESTLFVKHRYHVPSIDSVLAKMERLNLRS